MTRELVLSLGDLLAGAVLLMLVTAWVVGLIDAGKGKR